jgi:hypothetical protein
VTGGAFAARSFNGRMALAVDVTNLTNISVTLPICLTGNVDVATKTLIFSAFFDGTPLSPTTPAQFFLDAYDPDPGTGYLGLESVSQGAWITYSAPLNASPSSGTTTQVVVRAGSFGAQFSGTVWIDDIAIQ